MNRCWIVLSMCLLALPSSPSRAQGSAKPAGSGEAKPGVARVREQMDDLNLLKSLLPLKLTGPQIEALLPPMREASKAAIGLQKQADEATLALGEEVARTHEGAVGGKPIPESLEKKIAEAARAAAERYQAARRKAVGEILAVAKEKLTKTQKEEIEKQCIAFYGGKRVPKQYAENPEKAPRDVVLDLAVQGYIEQVLLFDRTLTLLEKMHAALEKS